LEWFENKLHHETAVINDLYSKYRISEVLMAVYKLVWDDFCSWYLEIIKPGMGQAMQPKVFEATIRYFEDLMKLLHPFMPFITEELWHSIAERKELDCIITANWPEGGKSNEKLLNDFDSAILLVSNIRNIRKQKNIPNKEPLEVNFMRGNESGHEAFHFIASKLCNLSEMSMVTEKPSGQVSIVVNNHEYFINTKGLIDQGEEHKKIKAELDYTRSFLDSVMKKLGNDRFVSNAKPEIIALEQKKKADAEAKILLLEKQLELNNN